MSLSLQYAVDPVYRFKYVGSMTEKAPSGLSRTTKRARSYADGNGDGSPDSVSETAAVNGKTSTLLTNRLQALRTGTSPEGRTVVLHYDPSTFLPTSIETPGLHPTTFGHDARGRLTTASTGARASAIAYDGAGNIATVTDPLDRTTGFSYDAVGRLLSMERADGSLISYSYDANGNMTLLTTPSGAAHGFGYNGVDLNSSYETPLSGSYQYVYDRDRRLTRTLAPSGREIQCHYDPAQLVRIDAPEGSTELSWLCSTKLGSVTRAGETIAYGYDGSLLTSATLSGTLSQTIGYAYNSDFLPSSLSYAGASAAYAYDDDGLLVKAGPFTISRNAANGLPESGTDGTALLTRAFSGYGEVNGQEVQAAGASLYAFALTRDNAGRIVARADTVGGVATEYAYGYDELGRLASVSRDGSVVESYRYGPNGARTQETNLLRGIASRSLAYSEEDHLLTAGEASYQFDPDGFLTQKIKGSKTTRYAYSSRGELLSAALPDGTSIAYLYDPLGRRIARKVNGTVVEKYLWQSMTRLLAVYDGSDALLMRFDYADGRMPVAMSRGGTTYYLAYDPVGSLRIVFDASGAIVKRVDYDSFGNLLSDSNPSFTIPFGFAGGLHDPDTNLVRFGYRDYDPDVGRWTAKDPIFFAGGDADLFGYCLGDPVNWVDPKGRSTTAAGALIGGSIGGPPGAAVGAVAGALAGAAIGQWAWDNWIANENTEESDDSSGDSCPLPTEHVDNNHDEKELGQQYDEILKAQDEAKKNRPSIKDDEWEGVKKRPKQNKINSTDKSKNRRFY
jgi:RHS repeat-associated protein